MSKSRQRVRAKLRLARTHSERRKCLGCGRELPNRSSHMRCAYCRAWKAGTAIQREMAAQEYQRTVTAAKKAAQPTRGARIAS